MTRPTLYSRSPRARAAAAQTPEAAPAPRKPRSRWRRLARRYRSPLLVALGAALALAGAHFLGAPGSPAQRITQDDIDAAVRHTLEKEPLPHPSVRAFEKVRGSVVRVRGIADGPIGEELEQSVGTGVVIIDNGTILTNLHVAAASERLKVVFADGLESDAYVVGLQPEHDLAVIRARTIPDDLHAATMRSTQGLQPGDHVTAVGFPFGIGPSASAGVISGLKRDFRSPEGQKVLSNLIQFDAAANPGNSGGPLVTAEGEVIGIVTAILNPTEQRVFIGIGFAVPIENAAAGAGLPPF
ncbi:MAG: trypsin-like peptidase domain-containing protein [Burkholderiales bacterium]|nr:trypsin-like peptidase domain-containing protein [Burkholderiales bacterium]